MEENIILKILEQLMVHWPLGKEYINTMNEWMFNDTPAQKTDRLLGVRKR